MAYQFCKAEHIVHTRALRISGFGKVYVFQQVRNYSCARARGHDDLHCDPLFGLEPQYFWR